MDQTAIKISADNPIMQVIISCSVGYRYNIASDVREDILGFFRGLLVIEIVDDC